MRMETSAAIPEAPAPEMTRPRMTCHMVWPMPLFAWSTSAISVPHGSMSQTYTIALLKLALCLILQDLQVTYQPTTKIT
jgi:hypothetical protein